MTEEGSVARTDATGRAAMLPELLACTTSMFWLFWRFLQTGSRPVFWATAALGGLSGSCKYTTVLVPPILGLHWWVDA